MIKVIEPAPGLGLLRVMRVKLFSEWENKLGDFTILLKVALYMIIQKQHTVLMFFIFESVRYLKKG